MSEVRRTDLADYRGALASQIARGRYAPQPCESIMKIVKVIIHKADPLAVGKLV